MSPYRVCFVVLALLLTLVSPALASDHNSTVEHNPPVCNADRTNWTIGLLFCNGEASQGYTLFSPIPSNTTYLIDEKAGKCITGRHPANTVRVSRPICCPTEIF